MSMQGLVDVNDPQMVARRRLARLSGMLAALDTATNKALNAFEKAHNNRDRLRAEDVRRKELTYISKRAALEDLYTVLVSYSVANEIAVLPEPSGLKQRGAR